MNALGDPLKHIESFLGTFADAWGPGERGIKVLRFLDRPRPATSVFATLGASDHVLALPSNRSVRQEFLFVLDESEISAIVVARFVAGVAEEVVARHTAVVRGELLGPRDSILGSELTALYCAMPVFLPDAFCECESSQPTTVFVWLIPIWKAEAGFVRAHGWSRFEALLEKANPNLFTLHRSPVTFAG